MPTIFTHAAVPLLLGVAAGRQRISRRLLGAGAIAAMLPDADTLGFKLGIAYNSAFGHRGATHSAVFALATALVAMALWKWLRTTPWRAFAFVGLAALSHPLLDALTDGASGLRLHGHSTTNAFSFHGDPSKFPPSALASSARAA